MSERAAAPLTFAEAMNHVWPSDLAHQLVGWMKQGAKDDRKKRREFMAFVAALTETEARQLRTQPRVPRELVVDEHSEGTAQVKQEGVPA